MRVLRLACKSCSAVFESGVPLEREHLAGIKLRTLEVCPHCGAAADYRGEEYLDPDTDQQVRSTGGRASGSPAPEDIPPARAPDSRAGLTAPDAAAAPPPGDG
jgi:hypothetical protein